MRVRLAENAEFDLETILDFQWGKHLDLDRVLNFKKFFDDFWPKLRKRVPLAGLVRNQPDIKKTFAALGTVTYVIFYTVETEIVVQNNVPAGAKFAPNSSS